MIIERLLQEKEKVLEKKRVRKELLEKRRLVNIKNRVDYGYHISDFILNTREYQEAKAILSFLSTEEEIDMSYFDLCAYQDNKTLAYPVILSKGVMEAYIPHVFGCYETNQFGIREPLHSESFFLSPDRIDLIIVPMLGFDSSGHRIGYGGGYYDRYLPKAIYAFKMGVCYQELIKEVLPVSENDIRIDSVITQVGRYNFESFK